MATIRVLAEDDIPAVAALFMRVYPEHGWVSRTACESYFGEILFRNPWRDLALPSWVAEEDGRIYACYAVLPRSMQFQGRPIRVAVGCQFMVDPGGRGDGLAWMQLAKACLSGPQDLTLADGASENSRRMWMAIGGTASLLYSLHWTRPLRLARYALSLLEERSAIGPVLALGTRPLAGLADALTARMRPNAFNRPDPETIEEPLDPAAVLDHQVEVLNGVALQPAYETRALRWLLDQAARKTRHGLLRARAVRDTETLIGWYLYYVAEGKVGEVIQVAARHRAFDRVLSSLLADAWRQGATALRGRLDPCHAQELSNRHCWFRREGTWMLVHSRHADVTAAIERGDAFLSRLDGEWFLRFLGG